MKIHRLYSLEQYQEVSKSDKYEHHLEFLSSLIPVNDCEFYVDGYSYVAERFVKFLCDFKCSGHGYPHVNWRERVECPVTGLNNRMRAAVHFFDLFSNTHVASNIYIMEQTTPLYKYLKDKHLHLVGSEYLGSSVGFGSINENGIRNEDATQLSFLSNSLDAILSFDVFEHIFDYKRAFSECGRVLRKHGCMIFTVPFSITSSENIERAVITMDGNIEHLMEPEYHGDPISGAGILCFRHYAWNVLQDLREAGFRDAYAAIFNSIQFGYYTNQIIFYAQK